MSHIMRFGDRSTVVTQNRGAFICALYDDPLVPWHWGDLMNIQEKYIKNSLYKGETNITNSTFDKLRSSTTESKYESEMWRFTDGKSRVYGLVFDYDHSELPTINSKYTYFIHRTHSDNYRIIFPLYRAIAINRAHYKNLYIHLCSELVGAKVDEACCNIERWFFSPKGEVIEHEGSDGLFHIEDTLLKTTFVDEESNSAKLQEDKLDALLIYDVLKRIKFAIDNSYGTVNLDFLSGECKLHPSKDGSGNKKEVMISYIDKHPYFMIKSFHHSCMGNKDAFIDILAKYDDPEVGLINNFANSPEFIRYLALLLFKGKYSVDKIIKAFLSETDAILYDRFKNYLRKYYTNNLGYEICENFSDIYEIYGDKFIIEEGLLEDYSNFERAVYNKEYDRRVYKILRCGTTPDIRIARYLDKGWDIFVKMHKAFLPLIKKFKGKCHNMRFRSGEIVDELGDIRNLSHNEYVQLSSSVNYKYNKNANCPNWINFLNTSIPDPIDRRLLQQVFGYCLISGNNDQKMLVLTGDGGSGKSIILRVFNEVFTAKPFAFLSYLDSERTWFDLDDYKVLTLDEVPAKFKDEETLKQMTGNTPVVIRYLGGRKQRKLTQIPLTVMASNNLEFLDLGNISIRRRALIISGFKQIMKPDYQLADKLTQETDGILNWAIEGLKDYREEGFINNDGAHKQASRIREAGNDLMELILDNPLWQGNGWYKAALVREIYEKQGNAVASMKKLASLAIVEGIADDYIKVVRCGEKNHRMVPLFLDSNLPFDDSRRITEHRTLPMLATISEQDTITL